MPYAVRYREELPEPVQRELDDMIAYFNHQLEVIQAPDGTLLPAALVPPAEPISRTSLIGGEKVRGVSMTRMRLTRTSRQF